MKTKEAWYAVIGGVVGAVLSMIAGSVVPTGAQDEVTGLNVGEITCTGLRVVDGGGIDVINKNEQLMARIGVGKKGGFVAVHDKQGEKGVAIGIKEFGGLIVAHGKDQQSLAGLFIDKSGGSVLVIDENGESRWFTRVGVSPDLDFR